MIVLTSNSTFASLHKALMDLAHLLICRMKDIYLCLAFDSCDFAVLHFITQNIKKVCECEERLDLCIKTWEHAYITFSSEVLMFIVSLLYFFNFWLFIIFSTKV